MFAITLDKRYSLLEEVYTLLFVMLPFPFIGIYKTLPISTVGLWGLLGCLIFFLRSVKNPVIKFEKKLLIFCLYVIVVTLLMGTVYEFDSLGVLLKRQVVFFLLVANFYWLTPKVIDFRLAIKAYIFFTVAVSVLLLIQSLAGHLGHPFVLLQSGMVVDALHDYVTDSQIYGQLASQRWSSIFLEPAHFCQYVLVGLVLILFADPKNCNKYLKAAVVTVAIIASSSTLGLVVVFVVWSYYYLVNSNNAKKAVLNLILFGTMVSVFGFVILSNDVLLNTVMGKINSFADGEVVQDTSTYFHIVAGWITYLNFPIETELFGCGLSYVDDYIKITGYGLQNYATTRLMVGYMACLPQLFCEFGLFGMILFFLYVFTKIINKFDATEGMLLLLWLLLADVVEESFVGRVSPIPLVFALAWAERKNELSDL